MTKIITNITGPGHYNVTVMKDYKSIGSFETTDMHLIDDITEMNSDGFESELMGHESFEDVVNTCVLQLKQ